MRSWPKTDELGRVKVNDTAEYEAIHPPSGGVRALGRLARMHGAPAFHANVARRPLQGCRGAGGAAARTESGVAPSAWSRASTRKDQEKPVPSRSRGCLIINANAVAGRVMSFECIVITMRADFSSRCGVCDNMLVSEIGLIGSPCRRTGPFCRRNGARWTLRDRSANRGPALPVPAYRLIYQVGLGVFGKVISARRE